MRYPVINDGATVAIFGGSFDPITFAHLMIAVEIINFSVADQVWMVPCGMRPDKDTVVSPHSRLEMLSLALDEMLTDDVPVYADPTEVNNGQFIPTVHLMSGYRKRYPTLNFKLLIGDDLLASLHTWDGFRELITENRYIVYTRKTDSIGDQVILNDPDRTVLQVERLSSSSKFIPMLSTASSSELRHRMEVTGDTSKIAGLTPKVVVRYIADNRLYI
jgi:nicotinate-nucleotide adenylyltransferase